MCRKLFTKSICDIDFDPKDKIDLSVKTFGKEITGEFSVSRDYYKDFKIDQEDSTKARQNSKNTKGAQKEHKSPKQTQTQNKKQKKTEDTTPVT